MKVSPFSFVPRIIRKYENNYGEKPWEEWASGTVLFADVSGFTPLSESLSVLGAEGAEIISDILNRYFSTMISIIHENGGEVMKFGGDAILCFFQGSNTLPLGLYSAYSMQKTMTRFQRIKTPVKQFSLKMKIGVAQGHVLLAGVGDPSVRREYAFAGLPVDLTSDAEHKAQAGDIVLTCSKDELPKRGFEFENIGHDFFRLLNREADLIYPEIPTTQEKSENEALVAPYMINEVLEMVTQGFAKHIGSLQSSLPVFMQFSGFTYTKETFDLKGFHDFFSTVIHVTHKYHGRLNHINMGDKGSTFFLLFGSPLPIEKKEELASMWALELLKTMKASFPYVKLGIGMNTGRIFSGIIGGSSRYDYTNLGDTVNFAARLMQKAEESQILASESLYKHAKRAFNFDFLGKKKFKGKAEALSVYQLKTRKQSRKHQTINDSRLVGRKAEIESINKVLNRAKKGHPSLFVIQGQAGVGKSFLTQHVLKSASKKHWNVVHAKGAITRQSHSYSPWFDCFRSLFFDGKEPNKEDIKELLRKTNKEFEPYLNLHCEFFHVPCHDGEDEIDEQRKKKLLQHQLITIFFQRIAKTRTIVFLDDLQWFDSLSLEFLSNLFDHSKMETFCVIATARSEWRKESFLDRPFCRTITLDALKLETLKELTENFLEAKAKDELVQILNSHTHGNPFFALQFLEYLHNKHFLEKSFDEWTVKKDAQLKTSFTGEDIIIAQIEQLPPVEKVHIRFAACIGPSINHNVVRCAMGKLYRVKAWKALVNNGLLKEEGDSSYSFLHTITQDIIYNSIPRSIRKTNHRKSGKAIEKIHSSNLDQWFPNLSNHYFLAESRKKAIHYSIKAGKQAYKNLMYLEACRFYERAHNLLKYTSDERKWELGILLAWQYVALGKFDMSIKLSKNIQKLALKKKQWDIYFRSSILHYKVMEKVNDFSYINLIEKHLKHSQLKLNVKKDLLYALGVAFFRQGEFERAKEILNNVTAMINDHMDGSVLKAEYQPIAQSYHNLASISRLEGQFPKALSYIEIALELAKKFLNYELELNLQFEKAGIFMDGGHYNDAKELYESLVKRCQDSGDISLLGTIFLNYGDLAIHLNQLVKAERYIKEALLIFSKIGNKTGIGNAHNLLGIISYQKNNFIKSYEHYYRSVSEFKTSGELNELIFGYYNLAEVCLDLDRIEEAQQWLQKFHDLALKTKNQQYLNYYNELKSMVEQKQM